MHKSFHLLAILCALLLGACSLTRVAYNYATPVLTWYVDDFVDLSDSQRDWIRVRIDRAFEWHRRSELPEYQRFLRSVMLRAAAPLTEDDARAIYEGLRGHYRRALEFVLPDIADLLLTLEAEQIDRLERKFAESNDKIVNASVKGTPEDRRRRRANQYIDHFEVWAGRLSGEQRSVITTRVHAMRGFTEEWLGDRRFRQSEFLALLRAKPDRARMLAGLRRLLLDMDTWRRPEYIAMLHERDRRIFEMAAAVSLTLTPEQRTHLQKKLGGYLQDVVYLMAAV